MNPLPLLSTGQQEFSELRTKNLVYVDKTEFIYKLLAKQVPFFFLSRPRRFGKSLLINTLKELFLGRKELFEGLYIYDKIEWQTYPLIHIDCSKLGFRELGLQKALQNKMKEIAEDYEIELTATSAGTMFAELMQKLYEKTQKQVVILVDEYDKPITDVLEQGENTQTHQNREVLRMFYSVVKGSSAYIRFFFLTGITRFTKVSLFSDLNNLVDISFDDAFHNFLGYTQAELESYFQEHLVFVAEKQKLSLSQLLEKVKYWYNGYSWNGIDRLYNPFSILRFLDSGKFMNYWFESGTPKMLVQLLKKEWLYDLRNIKANMSLINNFDIDNLNAETLLFQTGYLTITDIDKYDRYTLNYPNKEVEQSLLQYLLADYSHSQRNVSLSYEIATAIENNDIPYLCQTLNQLFSAIPYQIFQQHSEGYFHSVVFIALKLCGFYIESEISTSKGRIDAVMLYQNRTYLFEFKLDENPQLALEQIQQKEYFKKYLHTNKEIYLVGINFSSAKKEIEKWQIKKLEV